MGVLDRLMRASVERAQQMQPRRVQRVVDDHLYAAPNAREQVEAITRAGARLARSGMAPAGQASIAVRRSPTSATVVAPGSDLAALDNRHLERVALDDGASPALSGVRAGDPAAVWAFPPALLALAATGLAIEPVSEDLARVAGVPRYVESLAEVGSGLTVVVGRGVVSGHLGPVEAVERLEAAESLARMTIDTRTLGSSHG